MQTTPQKDRIISPQADSYYRETGTSDCVWCQQNDQALRIFSIDAIQTEPTQ